MLLSLLLYVIRTFFRIMVFGNATYLVSIVAALSTQNHSQNLKCDSYADVLLILLEYILFVGKEKLRHFVRPYCRVVPSTQTN